MDKRPRSNGCSERQAITLACKYGMSAGMRRWRCATANAGKGDTTGTGFRHAIDGTVVALILRLRGRFRRPLRMAQQMRECRLLRTDQQQRQQQRKKWVVKTPHGMRIKTQSCRLINLQHQTLQVLPFRKCRRNGVIRTALQAPDNTSTSPRVQRCAGNDFLEQVQADTA